MVQESFYSTTLKSVVKRIDKRVAEKMFNQGETIYFCSSNMMFDSVWQSPCPTNKAEIEESMTPKNPDKLFDFMCADYRYYNCDAERGRRIKFYIKEK